MDTAPAPLDGPFGPAHRRLTAGVVLCTAVIALQVLGVATVLPEVARELGGLGSFGWAVTAALVASAPGMVAGGAAVDRGRPVAGLAAGLVLVAAGSAAATLAPTWAAFLGARVVQGLGFGVLGSLVYAAIARAYPGALHGRVLAALSSAWVLPALLGPFAAGLAAELSSWRWVFGGVLPLLPVVAVLAGPPLAALPAPEAVARDERRRERAARVLLAATLRARPVLGAGLACRGLLAVGFLGAESFLPLGLVELRGLSVSEAGLALSAGSLSWSAGALWQGRLDGRDGGAGRTRRLRAGAAVLAVGTGLAGLGVTGLGVGPAVAGWALGGLGVGMAYPSASSLVLGAALAHQAGAASAALQLVETLGVAAFAAIGGVLLGAAGVEPGAVGALFAAGAAGALLCGGLAGRTDAQDATAAADHGGMELCERALELVRLDLEDSGNPAYTCVAFDDEGQGYRAPMTFATHPAADAFVRRALSEHDPARAFVVSRAEGEGGRVAWTVFGAHDQKKLLRKDEVAEDSIGAKSALV